MSEDELAETPRGYRDGFERRENMGYITAQCVDNSEVHDIVEDLCRKNGRGKTRLSDGAMRMRKDLEMPFAFAELRRSSAKQNHSRGNVSA